MAKQAFDQANEAIVDERYQEAHELYTQALTIDDKADPRFTSKIYAARAQCALKSNNYSDALKDTDEALRLDDTNTKARLRQGVAFYSQGAKEKALEAFVRGLEHDVANVQLKEWHDKCQNEVLASQRALPPPPPIAKIRHSFYQTDSTVVIQIPIKGLRKDQVQIDSTDSTLKVDARIPVSGHDFSLDVELAYSIDSSRTSFHVSGINIEVKLYKRQAIQWPSLDAQSSAARAHPPVPMGRPQAGKTPSYPSSSQRAKNWDKVEAEIKKDEKENKEDMGDANAIFQRLFLDSDENTRRAMNKSMYESGGTCLSMNWEEVSKGRVACEPPEGMEWKKYDS